MNAFLRSVLLTCAVVVGGALVVWLAFTSQLHEEIRHEVERRFAERYREFRVCVRHARMRHGRGIEIHGLSICRRSDNRPLAYVDEVFAKCPIDAESLLSGAQPPTDHVYLSGLKLWTSCRDDGSWDVEALWPLPPFGASHPPVSIRDATIEVVDPRGGVRRALNFRNVGVEILPDASPAERAAPRASAPPMRVHICADGDHFDRLICEAWVAPARHVWSVRGKVQALRWSDRLRTALPADIQSQASLVASVQGRVDLAFQAANGPAPDAPPRFRVHGSLAAGQIRDARLPFPLFDVRGQFALDNAGWRLDHGFACNGDTTLTLQLERQGWRPDSPLTINGQVRQLELDRRCLNALPPNRQVDWRKYDPAGTIDAEFFAAFDGRRWTPEVTVVCQDVSFAYSGFPYRLERGRGTLLLKDNHLRIDMTAAAAAGQQVALQGEMRDVAEHPTGWLEFACRQPLPFDERLVAALVDPRAREVVQTLRPSGTFAVQGRFERTGPAPHDLHRRVQLELLDCGIHYKLFPYPVTKIRGHVLWDDDGWTFEGLSGRNGSAYIEGAGQWRAAAGGGHDLRLDLTGADVPLEDELHNALHPGIRALWSQLRPRGTVDHLDVEIRYASASHTLDLGVTAQKWQKKINDEGRNITIQPVWFPYRLDDVSGTVLYRNGQIQLQGITATHDQTRILVSGACSVGPDGTWTVQLPNVVADRVALHRDLLAALPKDLSRGAERLNFTGDLSLRGALAFSGELGRVEPPSAAWDVILDVEDGRLNIGFPLEHMHGEVHLVGTGGAGAFSSRGELNIDSVMYRDVQLTAVTGPMWIDRSGICLGAEADAKNSGRIPQSLSAQSIGGQLTADVRVDFEPDSPFHVQVRLERGDLNEFAQDTNFKSQNIRGRANALLTLSGDRHGWSSWRGTGAIRLFDADIYEIPVMLALLKLLSIRRPDTTAFTSSEIDFRVQGEHVYLDRVNFNGDAISLKGSGEMDLQRRIDLKFYSLVGPGELNIPIVRAVVRQAAKQLLLIHVTGTLDQPQLTRDPLPLLKGTLEQIFPEAVTGEVLPNLPALGRRPTVPVRR